MAHASSAMLWVVLSFYELGHLVRRAMLIYYDNQSATFIMNYPTFYEHTNHINIDFYTICNRALATLIVSPRISSSGQLSDIFTKALSITSYHSFL